jgi:hypothetical protein
LFDPIVRYFHSILRAFFEEVNIRIADCSTEKKDWKIWRKLKDLKIEGLKNFALI